MSGTAPPGSVTPPPSAIKLALQAKQVRQQARTVLAADPIAIIGMACRLPGGADTPERFWALLRDGVDATREVPADRWDAASWFDPDVAAAGKATTTRGGFLDRVDGFDAGFFDILPREADQMDPQQRLFLEVAMEAIDDAGLPHPSLAGGRVGVFASSYHNDYAKLVYDDPEAIDLRTLTGTLHSVLANRLSYLLDLRGPSLSVDTACSSSLVAIHLACQSLRFGETDLAVAGGVQVMAAPEMTVALSKVGFMAPDGRCKSFDAAADGFGRGEGSGVVLLKRLSDAIADKDRVLGVIRGSAVNQDGRSTVLTAPNGPAQAALIREALAGAQLDPARIGFVEAHGTGTALGDPIEVEAIAETLGQPVPGGAPLLLGSAKANLAHLESAAGIAGLIKLVLALRHGAVPPQPGFGAINPHISLAGTRVAIPTVLTPWPAGDGPRAGAVSGFGVGGTNAHVIVEEAPKLPVPAAGEERACLLPLSARSAPALRALAESWIGFLETTGARFADLAHTASVRRTHHRHRFAVAGRSAAEWRARLDELLRDGALPAVAPRAARPVFVFSGQGPQWFGMGRELLASEPVFRDALAECDALLRPLSGWSLLEELARPEATSRLDETEVAQPAIFALQVALAALWRGRGVLPGAVIGHSVGEIAALHVAGVLELAEAVRVVWHRARSMQRAAGGGRMAAVSLDAAQAAALVRPFGDRLGVGAVNGPRSAVLSGEAAALDAALAALDGVEHRMLPVRYAFHSAQMAPFADELSATLGRVAAGAPRIPVYSTVTGTASGGAFDAAYFGRNVRDTVRFADAVAAALADGFAAFLEIGPHPVLAQSVAECAAAAGAVPAIAASLRRGRPEQDTLLAAAAALYGAGVDPDWSALAPPGAVVSLPAYPWQRARHWLRARPAPAPRAATPGGHPLLGRRLAVAGVAAQVFEGEAGGAMRWLAGHRIFGRVLLPGAAVMEGMLAAATAALGWAAPQLAGFAMHRPLVLPETGAAARWQVVVTPSGEDRAEISWFAAAGEAWQRVASAFAEPGTAEAETLPAVRGETLAAEALHARFHALGLEFGPDFRCLGPVALGEGAAEAAVRLPAGLDAAGFVLHPVLLDAALQLCPALAGAEAGAFLPLGADRVRLRPGSYHSLLARARRREGEAGLVADVQLLDSSGAWVAAIEGMRFAPADRDALSRGAGGDQYEVIWESTASPTAAAAAPGRWLVLAEAGGAADGIADDIEHLGGQAMRLRPGAGYARTAPDAWEIAPGEAGDFRRVLAECGAVDGVLHGWSLDGGAEPADSAALDAEDARGVGAVLQLVQALAATGAAPALRLVTRGAQAVTGTEAPDALRPRAAALWGFAGVVAAEHPEFCLRVIDLDPAEPGLPPVAELLADGAQRLARRGGTNWLPRLRRLRVAGAERPVQAVLARPGTLDGLELRPLRRAALRPGEVRLRVLAAGLNFRDVLATLDLYPGAAVPPLGVECTGVVAELGAGVAGLRVGDRVFGYAPGSLAGEVAVPAEFLAPVPEGFGAEAAAGLAVPFLTAWYGLHRLAELRGGERVLIHAAAGGVGLAAVQLAQRAGAEVFATAGSPAKRERLRRLGVAHVFDSRSLDFAEAVLDATGGRGVAVVLNSLAGEFIPASLRALAPGGRFLELGKRGVWTAAAMRAARPDVAYHLYDLGAAAEADRGLLPPLLGGLVAALRDGALRPLPTTVFPLAAIGDAMRHMAQARHVGKIVLRVGQDAAPPVRAAATYWITGGLGGIGLDTAAWLVRRGARHLVLTGRRAPEARAAAAIRALEAAGATVRVRQADAADAAGMAAVLAEIDRSMPPLRGVVHAAGTLHDAALVNQGWEGARGVLRGKAHGAWVLHALMADRALDFFTLYSAASTILGAPGQGLYPAANAELDALARYRQRLGRPGLSVAWGVWSGSGMAATMAEQGREPWQARGLGRIGPAGGFAALEQLLAGGVAQAAVLPMDWTRFLARLPAGVDRGFFAGLGEEGFAGLGGGGFAGLGEASSSGFGEAGATARPAERTALPQRLRALPAGQRRAALVAEITERALRVLNLDAATRLDPSVPLKELGLDSLMAVEMRNTLVRATGAPLPATLLFDHPTVAALASYLGRSLGLEDAPPDAPAAAPAPPAPAEARPADAASVAALSDAEAEAQLLAELELGGPEAHR